MIYAQFAGCLFPKPTVVHFGYRRPGSIFAVMLMSVVGMWGQAQSQAPVRPSVRSVYEHGQEALRKGDLVSARTDFEQAVQRAPGNAQFRASLGWVLWRQGELDNALNQFKAVLRIKPD